MAKYSVGLRTALRHGLGMGLALGLLSGCANPFATDRGASGEATQRVVYAKPKAIIAVGPDRDFESAEPNDHPATFNRLDMAYLLRDIRVKLDGSRQRGIFGRSGVHRVRLFSRPAIKRLARPLASAFGEASPRQDVIVYAEQKPQLVGPEGNLKPGGLLEASRVTSARLFVRDQELHVIAGAVGINPRAKGDGGSTNLGRGDLTLDRLKSAAPAGTRAGPREKTGPLAGRFAANRSDRGRPDWLVVDYPRLLASVAGQRPDEGSAALEAIDYEPAEVGSSPRVQEVEPADAERSKAQRLRTLKRLRDDGIITEAEYERRKAEIEAAPAE